MGCSRMRLLTSLCIFTFTTATLTGKRARIQEVFIDTLKSQPVLKSTFCLEKAEALTVYVASRHTAAEQRQPCGDTIANACRSVRAAIIRAEVRVRKSHGNRTLLACIALLPKPETWCRIEMGEDPSSWPVDLPYLVASFADFNCPAANLILSVDRHEGFHVYSGALFHAIAFTVVSNSSRYDPATFATYSAIVLFGDGQIYIGHCQFTLPPGVTALDTGCSSKNCSSYSDTSEGLRSIVIFRTTFQTSDHNMCLELPRSTCSVWTVLCIQPCHSTRKTVLVVSNCTFQGVRKTSCLSNKTVHRSEVISVGSGTNSSMAAFTIFVRHTAFRQCSVDAIIQLLRLGYVHMVITDSSFIRNRVTHAPIAIHAADTPQHTLQFAGCTFRDNVSKGNSAAVLLNYSATTDKGKMFQLVVEHCFFTDNKLDTNGTEAGVRTEGIWRSASLTTSCHVSRGGRTTSQHPCSAVTLRNCTFSSADRDVSLIALEHAELTVESNLSLIRGSQMERLLVRPIQTRSCKVVVNASVVVDAPPTFIQYLEDTPMSVFHLYDFLMFVTMGDKKSVKAIDLPYTVEYSANISHIYQEAPYCKPTTLEKSETHYPCLVPSSLTWRFWRASRSHSPPTTEMQNMCNLYGNGNQAVYGGEVDPYDDLHAKSANNRMVSRRLHVLCRQGKSVFIVSNAFAILLARFQVNPTWLAFQSSSTQCVKVVAGKARVFDPCEQSDILKEYEQTLIRSRWKARMADEALDAIVLKSESWTNVLLGPAFLILPWAHASGISDGHTADNKTDISTVACPGSGQYSGKTERQQQQQQQPQQQYNGSWIDSSAPLPVWNVAHTVLLPAPGEEISLRMVAFDHALNPLATVLRLEVCSPGRNVLLLRRRSGTDRGHTSSLTFSSHQELPGFALAGLPGTAGHLVVSYVDDITKITSTSTRKQLRLKLPFVLRPCHHGYELRASTSTGWLNKQTSKQTKLTCECAVPHNVGQCEDSRSVAINKEIWAGDVNTTNTHQKKIVELESGPSAAENDVVEIVNQSCFHGYVFGYVRCRVIACQKESWRLDKDEPCKYNTTGPLCGRCQPGTQPRLTSIANADCVRCSSAKTISVAVYIVVTVAMTTLFALLLFFFNAGHSPLLDSWLFYVQAAGYAYGNSIEKYGMMFGAVKSFGLGYLCFSPQLTRLQLSALSLLQPFTLLIIFLVVRIGRSYRPTAVVLQRPQKHMRLVRVMWLVFVFSYSMLVHATSAILRYDMLNNVPVLNMDGSLRYFGPEHRPYAVAAILILLVFVVPPPIILLIPAARGNNYLRVFIDEACRLYRFKRTWWAAIGLGRLLGIALYGTFWRNNPIIKALVAAVCLQVLLICHILARPLRPGTFLRITYNMWEMFFLFLLSFNILMMLGQRLQLGGETLKTASAVLFLLPTVLLLLGCMLKQCFDKRGGFGRLRRFSLRLSWERWLERRSPRQRHARLSAMVLDNMSSGIREPMLIARIREEQEAMV